MLARLCARVPLPFLGSLFLLYVVLLASYVYVMLQEFYKFMQVQAQLCVCVYQCVEDNTHTIAYAYMITVRYMTASVEFC